MKLTAIILAALAMAGVTAHATTPAKWLLIVSDGHDEYVMDHGLTAEDCAREAPRHKGKGRKVWCEPEGPTGRGV